MNRTNHITRLLNIKYPIVQAPMFGVTTPEMVAAAPNINYLGSLALADLDADSCIEIIRKAKQLTKNPFAVKRHC
jgi:nitronate monooxygenase